MRARLSGVSLFFTNSFSPSSRTGNRTLGREFDTRRNSLNFLRLLFAGMVIVSHTWPLGGYGNDPGWRGESFGSIAVLGFFSISGWLITGSRVRSSFARFVSRRLFRIYPGYIVCLLVVALVFGPVSRVMSGARGYDLGNALGYVARNSLLRVSQPGIAGTLEHSPYRYVWDGSLWTLMYEFGCYIVVGALYSLFRRHFRYAVLATFGCCTVLYVLGVQFGLSRVATPAYLGAFFFAGALLYVWRDRIPVSFGWFSGILVLVLLAWLMGSLRVGAPIFFAYTVLWLGCTLPFSRIGAKNDISYGVYIYGFPVQQSLWLASRGVLGAGTFILASAVLVAPFAWFSWALVERPTISLGRRLRGDAHAARKH